MLGEFFKEHHEDMAESLLKLCRNNPSSRNNMNKAFVNCHYIFGSETWSENTSSENIHDKKKRMGIKLPKSVFVSSNPSSYFFGYFLLLSPSCWNHKGIKMQGHEWRQGVEEKWKKGCKKIMSSWRNLFHRFINLHPTGNGLPLNCLIMTIGPMEPIVGLTKVLVWSKWPSSEGLDSSWLEISLD